MQKRHVDLVGQELPRPAYSGIDAPLPYPTGWFMLATSKEIPPGTVATRHLMGGDVVVYRTSSGRLRVVRPNCPHLGAHLGCGSWVEGENIVCPFHQFAFDPDGQVAQVGPGYSGQPVQSTLGVVPSQEVNGAVFAWSGPRTDQPHWRIPQMLDPRSSPMRFRSVALDTHPQEVFENIVDVGHLFALHKLPHAELLRPPVADEHSYTIDLRLSRRIPAIGTIGQNMKLTMFGLGFLHVELRAPKVGMTLTSLVAPRPVAPWRTYVQIGTSVLLAPPDGPLHHTLKPALAAAARAVTHVGERAVFAAFAADFPVWHRKRYLSPPRIAKGDGPIGAYRQWAHQFYPQGDPA
ncbi:MULTISPECIES: Rieske 2Fe-2S domain-containing protein [unclassified Streptomyces]|uniref:Rieske 2Fe-2S domain-containing protein n=1 Tax=unclassified Streptomyces TaxID=2593676 RepID=UPI00278C72BB|nr:MULTISPECIES: Rieske 2Fe-2S domain-containing protein [unclassified Streptomyces]